MTDEAQSTVDEWYAKAQPRYPIAILKTKEFENALGVRFFPTAGVISPDGILSFAGSAGDKGQPLKEALASATKAPLFPSKLSKVQSKMAAGDLGAAWAEVAKVRKKAGQDDELDRWTERFAETISGQAASILGQAKSAAAEGLLYRAVDLLEPLLDAKVPFPVTEEASDWLASLEGDEGYADEIKAGALHAKAAAAEDESDYTAACKAYVKAAGKYPDTRLAEAARRRAQILVDRGWPGYTSSCSSCRKAKRACSKHAETVKL